MNERVSGNTPFDCWCSSLRPQLWPGRRGGPWDVPSKLVKQPSCQAFWRNRLHIVTLKYGNSLKCTYFVLGPESKNTWMKIKVSMPTQFARKAAPADRIERRYQCIFCFPAGRVYFRRIFVFPGSLIQVIIDIFLENFSSFKIRIEIPLLHSFLPISEYIHRKWGDLCLCH